MRRWQVQARIVLVFNRRSAAASGTVSRSFGSSWLPAIPRPQSRNPFFNGIDGYTPSAANLLSA
jgi:hypothetical protein